MCTYVHLIPYPCLMTIWEFKGAALSRFYYLKKWSQASLVYEKRNSQILISNFKFHFNRKILKMCTSKLFHVLYIHVCVYVYIEILMYHTHTQNLSGNIFLAIFPHVNDIRFLKNVDNIIKNNITLFCHQQSIVYIITSSYLSPFSINGTDFPHPYTSLVLV